MIGLRRGVVGKTVDPNLKLELKFNSQVFTDVAGTVAAGTNDYVRAWRSTVGGHLLTQATDAARPQRQSDGLYFDGGDTVAMTVPANWLTGDFTLRLWANVPPMLALSQVNGGSYAAIILFGTNGLYTSNNGTSWAISGISIGGASAVWAHYAIAGNGANIRTYKDGVQVASQAYTAGLYYNSTNQIVLGKFYGGSTMTGKMTDIQLYSECLYPNGTSFTPPARSA